MEVKRFALIGRPNVGKSRLFNRLVGSQASLVCDYAGLTRDYQEAVCASPYEDMMLIDTPGIIPEDPSSLQKRLNAQTQRAAEQADALVWMIDSREGVTSTDRTIAEWLRQFFRRHPQKPVVLVMNKAEHRLSSALQADVQRLGWGDPIALSAEHGHGMGDLYTAMTTFLSEAQQGKEEGTALESVDPATKPIRVAIMGRPNAGKSTLTNALLGEDRLLTGPEAGLTRDAISLPWSYGGQPLVLIDTAGQRKRSKVIDPIEKMTWHDGCEALRYADVAIVVMEATSLFEKQDLSLAQRVLDEGRVLILAINKWDQVQEDSKQWRQKIQDELDYSLGHLKGIAWFPISALHGTGFQPMMKGVLQAYKAWNMRISTGQLNRWLKEALETHAPPASKGVSIRAKYMTQIKSRPPTFHLFVSRSAEWPESYVRYLANHLRETFHLKGIPVRIQLRQSHNPYQVGSPREKKS